MLNGQEIRFRPHTGNGNYGVASVFPAVGVADDFGPRKLAPRNWHGGIDYNAWMNSGNADLGYLLLVPEGGTIVDVNRLLGPNAPTAKEIALGTGTFRYLCVHVFRNSSSWEIWENENTVLVKRMLGLSNADKWAMVMSINDTVVSIGQVEGFVVHNGDTLSVSNELAQYNPIGTLGNSGTSFAHLHLNTIPNNQTGWNNTHNKNPLQYVDYEVPEYDVQFFSQPGPDSFKLNYPGTVKSPFCVRPRLSPVTVDGNSNNRYSRINDVNQVEIFLRKRYELEFAKIKGAKQESILSLGGRIGTNLINHTLQQYRDGQWGDWSRTGVNSFAYNTTTNANGHPYDDFYFTDFYTRIHRDDPMDGGTPKIAYCPEQARYNDGEYDLEARVTTIREAEHKAEASFILDNYMPYIRAVTLTARQIGFANPIVESTREWTCNGSCVSMYNPPPIEVTKAEWYAFLATPSVMVRAEASEPLGNLTLDLYQGTTTIANDIAAVQVDASEQVYIFDLSAYIGVLTGEVKMRFSGYDKSNNPLLDFSSASSSPSTSGCFSVPTRNSDTEWYNPDGVPNSGGDNTHAICIDCGPNFVSPNCVSIVLVDDGEECLAVSATVIDVSAPGQADGKVSLDISGGVPPYDIYWADGSSATELHNLGPGQYCVTINDALCCEYQACYTVGGGCPDAPKPYISMAKVWAGSELIYEGKWTGSGCVSFVPNDGLPANQSTIHAIQQGAPIKIEATVNTALDWLVVSLPGTGASGLGAPIGTGDGRHWLFEFPSGVPNMAATPAGIEQPLSFTGAGAGSESEPLLDLLAMDDGSGGCITLPALQDDCNWLPPGQSGSDNVHIIVIEGCDGLAGPEGTLCPLIYPVQSCGAADGSIVFRGNCSFGGQYPLTYAWSNGTSTLNNYNLTGGLYTLTVTDGIGCQGVFDYFVPSFGAPMISQEYSADIDACAGLDNGYLEVGLVIDPNDNTPMDPLFEWSHGLVTSGDFVSIAEDLAPGEYCVTITNQATGCQTDACYTISALEPDGPLALAVDGISSSCYHSATGQAEVAITGGVMPYYRSNGQQVSGGTLSLSGLPAGEHCETITDHCGESVEVCFDVPVIESSNFDVQLSDLQHVSAPGANDGHAHIAVSPQGNYAYSWRPLSAGLSTATDEASGLSPGDYWVLVEDLESGCQRRLDFNIRECEEEEAGFDVAILGGLIMPGDEEVSLLALIDDADASTPSFVTPTGYVFSWELNGQPLFSNSNMLVLSTDEVLQQSDPFVTLVVSDGCTNRTKTQRFYICGESSDAEKFFVIDQNAPCAGGSDGSISIMVPYFHIEGDGAVLFLHTSGGLTPMPLQPLLGGVGYFAEVGGLTSGTHEFTLVIDDCEISFSYQIGEAQPQLEFVNYDNSINPPGCIYNEICDGNVMGTVGQPPFLDPANGTTIPCRSPIYCGENLLGYQNYGTRTCRVAVYRAMLNGMRNAALSNGGFFGDWFSVAYLDRLIQDSWQDKECAKVRYCLATLEAQFVWGNWKGNIESYGVTNNGCIRYRCTGLLAGFRVCPGDECEEWPTYPGTDNPPPSPTDCTDYQSFNLYGLIYAYSQGWLYDVEGFFGSPLQIQLANLSSEYYAGELPGAECAQIVFCGDNYEFYYHTAHDVSCADIVIPSYTAVYIDPEEGLGGGLIWEPQGETVIPVCEIIDTRFNDDGVVVEHIVQCRSAGCDEFGAGFYTEDCSSPHRIDYTLLANIFGVEPPLDDDSPHFRVFGDPFSVERFERFAFLKHEGRVLPKGILSTTSGSAMYDYNYGANVESKRAHDDLFAFISDWDSGQDLFAFNQQGEISIHYSGPLGEWELVFSSTDETGCELTDAAMGSDSVTINVAGIFKGALLVAGEQIAHSEESAVFFAKLSLEGDILALSTAQNVSKGEGYFEENQGFFDKKGLLTDYSVESGPVILGSQVIEVPNVTEEYGKLLALWDESAHEFHAVKKLLLSGEVRIMQFAVSPDGSFAVFAKHAGSYTELGEDKVGIGSEMGRSILLRFNRASGQFLEPIVVEGQGAENAELIYAPDGGLFLGMTITASLSIEGKVLEHQGERDIALVRFSPSGGLIWSAVYGGSADETVERLFYDSGRLFFAGQFWGGTSKIQIGDYTFLDYTPYGNEVYISEVFFSDLQQQQTRPANKTTHDFYINDKNGSLQSLKVYPNPFSGEVTLALFTELDKDVDILLLDVHGRPVQEWDKQALVAGANEIHLRTDPSLPLGVYLFKVTSASDPNDFIITKILRQ